MHKHSYSLFITVDRLLPELGTPIACFECACGSKLSSEEGLAIINAAQPGAQSDLPMGCLECGALPKLEHNISCSRV
jgi:hypothetical protein